MNDKLKTLRDHPKVHTTNNSQSIKQGIVINNTENKENEYLVYGYMHAIECKYNLSYPIPDGIFILCLLYYKRYFMKLDKQILPTPLTLLFAIYNQEELIKLE